MQVVGRILTGELLLKSVTLRQCHLEARYQLALFGVHAGIIGDAGAGARGGCVAAMVSRRVGQPSCSSKAAQARFCMKKSAV